MFGTNADKTMIRPNSHPFFRASEIVRVTHRKGRRATCSIRATACWQLS